MPAKVGQSNKRISRKAVKAYSRPERETPKATDSYKVEIPDTVGRTFSRPGPTGSLRPTVLASHTPRTD